MARGKHGAKAFSTRKIFLLAFSSMPPSRGKVSSSRETDGSHGKEDSSKPLRKRSLHKKTNDLELPGVQKLKSALRQTRRLLAKVGFSVTPMSVS